MMYIFPNREGGVYVFKNLKELKSVVDAIKRLPELDSIFKEPIPKPIPYAHPKHDVYHTLTGEVESFIWGVYNAFIREISTKHKPFEVSLYTYHGQPLKWWKRKVFGLTLSQLTMKNFMF